MLQNAAGRSPVGEKLRPELLAGDGHADGVLGHGDGRIPYQAVKPQAGNVHHILLPEPDRTIFFDFGIFVRGLGVQVIDLSVPIPAHFHPIWHQWIQGYYLPPAVPDDLGEGIPPQKKVGHKGFPEHEAGHLRVGGIMEKPRQGMLEVSGLSVSLPVVPEEMEGQACDGF